MIFNLQLLQIDFGLQCSIYRRSSQGVFCSPKFSVDVHFFLMNSLNVLFLQEATKNVQEN